MTKFKYGFCMCLFCMMLLPTPAYAESTGSTEVTLRWAYQQEESNSNDLQADNVPTGDSSNVWFWIGTEILSASLLGYGLYKNHKEQHELPK